MPSTIRFTRHAGGMVSAWCKQENWWNLDLTPEQFEDLRRRAQAEGYLLIELARDKVTFR